MKDADSQSNLLLEFFQDGRCLVSISLGPLKNVHVLFSSYSKYTGYLDNAHILSSMDLKYIEYLVLSKNICCLLSRAEVQILLPTASCLRSCQGKHHNKELARTRPSHKETPKSTVAFSSECWYFLAGAPRSRCRITGYRHPSGAAAGGFGSLFRGDRCSSGTN